MTNTIRYDRAEDGIVTLTLDDPTQSANTMNQAFIESMTAAVDRLEAERDSVAGVIVTSAKPTFFAGGDLDEMIKATPDDAGELTTMITRIKRDLRRLESFGKPVVAAINGSALGGGLEIALACHRRIVLDVPGCRLGFPEVTLGLLPGAGGVTRTVRLIGLAPALLNVLLNGRQFRPGEAVEVGVADEIAAGPDELLTAARAWIAANPRADQPWDRQGFKLPGGAATSPAVAMQLPAYAANLRKQLKGASMPSAEAILAVAVEGAQVDLDTAFTIETRYLVSLLTGQVAKNMIGALFFDMKAVNAGVNRPDGIAATRARKVAVLGAGMMGAGIAYACARAGLDVVLKDVSPEVAARGAARSQALLDRSVRKGRMSTGDAAAVLARIKPTADMADLAGCDVVIEAVFEDLDIKRSLLAEVAEIVEPGALIASNTSTLPITDIAKDAPRASDVIGMHFFSPVDKMPLLEIVVGAETGDAAIARAFDLGRLLGKTPIVVNDSRGFFTSRVIGAFMEEAITMLAEGVPPASIEHAALQAGYPTGPLALADEVTLTLMQHIRRQAEAAAELRRPMPAHALIDEMVDVHHRPGRAAGNGFYEYGQDGSRLRLWPGLAERITDAGRAVALEDIKERMLFAEALESAKCLREHVLRSEEDANVGSILGIGYPAWTGGVLRYIKQYAGGVEGFESRAGELASRYGTRFDPSDALRALD